MCDEKHDRICFEQLRKMKYPQRLFAGWEMVWMGRRGWQGWQECRGLRITGGRQGSSRCCIHNYLFASPPARPNVHLQVHLQVHLLAHLHVHQQVKFGVVVVSWQAALLVLGMVLLRWDILAQKHYNRRGVHTSGNELEVMAKLTTFLVVFVAIFCGWPCLLHFMAGRTKYSSMFACRGKIFIYVDFFSKPWLIQGLPGLGRFSPQWRDVSSSSPACYSGWF